MNLSNPTRLRSGFSLIEVLTVVSIVALLVLLVVPAVQSAREAARKARCSNNLRQLGIALHAYAAAAGTLPGAGNGKAYSLHTMLLPHLEMTSLYNSINFGVLAFEGPRESPNFTAACCSLEVFVCPSDGVPDSPTASTSYAGNNGIRFPGHGSDGVFPSPPSRSGLEIADGLSNTVALAEWVLSPGMFARDPKGSIFATAGLYNRATDYEPFVAECTTLDIRSREVVGNDKGRNWMEGVLGHTLYNHTVNLNGHSCLSDGAVQEGAFTAGSRHPTGAHSLFADGHSKFLSESISLGVWRALGTANGQEPVSVDGL